jgi:dephospho-CoA kinase
MEKKVFVLGLPGSGKSTAARYIQMLARINDWRSTRFNDYDILYEMFEDDDGSRFSRTEEHDGFDVHNHRAFDDALKEVEKRLLQRKVASHKQSELVIIEFSRNDYNEALKLFEPKLLRNAFFLFVDADIPACKQRIRERVAHHCTPDDHFVSEYIFEAYYQMDNRQYLDSIASSLNECCNIKSDRIRVIENTGVVPIVSFLEEINAFAPIIFGTPVCCPAPASVLEEVAPSCVKRSDESEQASEPLLIVS